MVLKVHSGTNVVLKAQYIVLEVYGTKNFVLLILPIVGFHWRLRLYVPFVPFVNFCFKITVCAQGEQQCTSIYSLYTFKNWSTRNMIAWCAYNSAQCIYSQRWWGRNRSMVGMKLSGFPKFSVEPRFSIVFFLFEKLRFLNFFNHFVHIF